MGGDGELRDIVTPEPCDAAAIDCWPAMRAVAERAPEVHIADTPSWSADLDAANGWPAWRCAFRAAFDAYDWDGEADRAHAIKAARTVANTVLGFASYCSSESMHAKSLAAVPGVTK